MLEKGIVKLYQATLEQAIVGAILGDEEDRAFITGAKVGGLDWSQSLHNALMLAEIDEDEFKSNVDTFMTYIYQLEDMGTKPTPAQAKAWVVAARPYNYRLDKLFEHIKKG